MTSQPSTTEDGLYSNDIFFKCNIQVFAKLGLLICTLCKRGIISSQLEYHILQHCYSTVTVEGVQKGIAECPITLCSGLKDERVLKCFQDLKLTHELIPFLETFDGIQCTECGYCCVAKSAMRAHYSCHHKSFDGQQRSAKVKLQSLFYNTVTHFKYFRVEGFFYFGELTLFFSQIRRLIITMMMTLVPLSFIT